jgi:hypothetical protein
LQDIQTMVAKTILDTQEAVKLRAILEEEKKVEEAYLEKEAAHESTKPYKITALPIIKKKFRPMRPLPGISYLATSGMYEELMSRRNAKQAGNMTRRNITEFKISHNILVHNSPIAA